MLAVVISSLALLGSVFNFIFRVVLAINIIILQGTLFMTSRVVNHTTKKCKFLVLFLLLEITQLVVNETLKSC
jgi:uncharacterized membrane protein YsdA (DUF1294 family)